MEHTRFETVADLKQNPLNEKRCKSSLVEMYRNEVLQGCKHLYYCLKYKRQFRYWLYFRVREKNAMIEYSPGKLQEMLMWVGEDGDVFQLMTDNWQ